MIYTAAGQVQSLQGTRRGSMGGGGDLVIVGQGLSGAQAMLCGAPCNVREAGPVCLASVGSQFSVRQSQGQGDTF